MELRDARSSDATGIREVARDSFAASYESVLDQSAIDALLEAEYTDERIASLCDDTAAVVVVATENEDVVGFAQGHLVEGDPLTGDLDWLHVHPDARGQGVGVQLLGEVVDRFEDENVAVVHGRVVEANEGGGAFYEAHGFERRSTSTVEIGDESAAEGRYERRLDDTADAVVETATGPDGEELFVDYTGSERGSKAPFYPTFSDRDLTDRQGWLCSNCESLATAMDSSGRISCDECENTRAATRWDASYL